MSYRTSNYSNTLAKNSFALQCALTFYPHLHSKRMGKSFYSVQAGNKIPMSMQGAKALTVSHLSHYFFFLQGAAYDHPLASQQRPTLSTA